MSWAVVMTKPNCENIAMANLDNQGFVSYLPRFLHRRLDGVIVKKPLFPRYIFTWIEDRWYAIRGTYGVSYLLMGEGGPVELPNSVVESIKRREGPDGFVLLDGQVPAGQFKIGERVQAVDGPLVDKFLIYDGMTARARVRVLINMLGRQVPATIDEKSLVAA